MDIPESKITLDKNGHVIDISKYDITFANQIIEQFMLTANETIAEKFYWLEAPFIYRVHESPDAEKISELNKFLFNFGYKIKGNKDSIHPKAFSSILEDIKGKDEINIIQQKTGKPLHLPIIEEVSEAIEDYLSVRPLSVAKEIFINVYAPYNPISTGTIRNLLKMVLLDSHANYKTERELVKETEKLYDLKLISSTSRIGTNSKTSHLGTPQGGIISPLLANVYLHSMDEWITREWENKSTKRTYSSSRNQYQSMNNTTNQNQHI